MVDPTLEKKIADAALLLLTEGGLQAITMRDVARAAGTTTPTLYARFRDREALLWALVTRVNDEVFRRVEKAKSAEQIGETLVRYLVTFPTHAELISRSWPLVMNSARPKPVMDFAKKLMMQQHQFTSVQAERTAIAMFAQVFGMAILIRNAGEKNPVSKTLFQTSRKALAKLAQGL
ncbi:MAG TPA: helix-turn-helix domain-containing protein [Terriglobales bacterium]|nr:helix-turn-helix domain-containing protein [Terriglobales bacterium]